MRTYQFLHSDYTIPSITLLTPGTEDFVVTIPWSFVANRWGVRTVLWCNLVPRLFMGAWALAIGMYLCIIIMSSSKSGVNVTAGHYTYLLPIKAILAGPFLALLGGECVFQSTIFTLTSALTDEYVER